MKPVFVAPMSQTPGRALYLAVLSITSSIVFIRSLWASCAPKNLVADLTDVRYAMFRCHVGFRPLHGKLYEYDLGVVRVLGKLVRVQCGLRSPLGKLEPKREWVSSAIWRSLYERVVDYVRHMENLYAGGLGFVSTMENNYTGG